MLALILFRNDLNIISIIGIALRVGEMTAAVQLIQALGGGWDVTHLPAASQVTSEQTPRQVSAPP